MKKKPQDPITDEEVAQFMQEFDEGLHQLPPEFKAALEKGRLKLFYRLRRMFRLPKACPPKNSGSP
jgi:hypothetical protein